MHTRLDWLDSWHSFSFGHHHDPANVHHGALLVNNDDRVAPGRGFTDHPHRDMEIVSWVLSGALHHRDSAGHDGVIVPGLAQRMRAGTGIVHSEMNASPDEEVHFVQMWVPPGRAGLTPGYAQVDIAAELASGELIPVASGAPGVDAAVDLDTPGTTLWAARLRPGGIVTVPGAPWVHVFVPLGSARLAPAGDLHTGDAVRGADTEPLALTAGREGAEILVWEMHVTIA